MISSDNGWSLHYASVNCTTHAWPWNSAVVAKRLHSKSLLNTTSCVEPCILRRASTQKMYRIGFAPANEPKMYTIDFGPGPAHASSLAQPGQRKPGRECGLRAPCKHGDESSNEPDWCQEPEAQQAVALARAIQVTEIGSLSRSINMLGDVQKNMWVA